MAKDMFKYLIETALDDHLVTLTAFPQLCVDGIRQAIDMAMPACLILKQNKGEGTAGCDREKVSLIDRAGFRGDERAGKDNIGHGVGRFPGYLPHGMHDISIDQNALARCQCQMLLPNLYVETVTDRGDEFKFRVPVQRDLPIRQKREFMFEIGEGKNVRVMFHVLEQLIVDC